MSIFGDYLRDARKRAGLTQAQVADMLGVLPNNYTPFETGTGYKLPDEDVLPSLAAFLKADLEEMQKRRDADAIWHRNAIESVLMAADFVKKYPEVAGKAFPEYLKKKHKDPEGKKQVIAAQFKEAQSRRKKK